MNGFYFSGNRNLFRINDNPRRCKLLKQGRLPVVSFISEMPQTKHFLDSFTMDITLATVSCLLNIYSCIAKWDAYNLILYHTHEVHYLYVY